MDNSTPLIFTQSKKDRKGFILPENNINNYNISDIIDKKYLRKNLADLPQVSESQVVRHFTNLSTKNHHVDKNFYPLGSCTMKYNPKINDVIAMHDNFTQIHPDQDEESIQGILKVYYNHLQSLSSLEISPLQFYFCLMCYFQIYFLLLTLINNPTLLHLLPRYEKL